MDDERRNETRFSANDSVSIQQLVDTQIKARIIDVSKNGLRICAPESIGLGTTVEIRIKATVAVGHVRYCIPVGEEFHLGIQLRDVYSLPLC